ncbi:MAG: glycoside hydrolase family 28 protein, partial [Bacteroidota bacterium]
VENVTLENIQITYPGRGNKAYAIMPTWRVDEVPEKQADYPEFSMFGELPAWGFYVRHVEGLTMKNVQLKIKEADYRPAVVLDDVKGATFQSLTIKGDDKPSDPIYPHQSEGIVIRE